MKTILLSILSVALFAVAGCNKHESSQASDLTTALVIIDVQNDYFPNGKMTLVGADEAGKKAKKLLEYYRNNNLPVIHIKHIALQSGATFFLPNTPGAEISPYVTPLQGEQVITKHYPNSFRETNLQDYLKSKGITNLVICGMMTDVCVDATTRAAMDLGFKNTVIADACATRDRNAGSETVPAEEVNESFMGGLSALGGLYANVLTADQYLKGK
jgi:nicotinamidase-related amidase